MVAVVGPAVGDAPAELQDMILGLVWHEKRRFSQELADHNMTISQFFTLMAIKSLHPGCTMGQLAEATQQVSATVTGIVDRLVERGWVRRRRAADDRRAVLVELTPDGHQILDRIHQAKREYVQRIWAHLSPEEREQFVIILRRYLSIIQVEA